MLALASWLSTGTDGQPLSKEIARELARSMNPGASTAKKAPLTWNQWQLAYPRFAIEAAVCGMVPYEASMGHMVRGRCNALLFALHFHCQVNCQRIAETASAEGNRQRWLGILYDEVCPGASNAIPFALLSAQECRKNWAERAYAGEKPDIAREALSINQERLFLAKSSYDSKVKVSCSLAFWVSPSACNSRSRRIQSSSSNQGLGRWAQRQTRTGLSLVQAQRFATSVESLDILLPIAGPTLPTAFRREQEKEASGQCSFCNSLCPFQLTGKHKGGSQGGAPKRARVETTAPAAAADNAALAASMAKFNELLANNKASAAGA